MDDFKSTLKFRLNDSVEYDERSGRLELLRRYPLQVLRLNLVWKPVFDLLSQQSWISQKAIFALVKDFDPIETGRFLHSLVCKGFIQRRGTPALTEFPKVSIIIPVKNRPQEIAKCLESLLRLDYPSDKTEIIVVDDGSTDGTVETVKRYPAHLISLKQNRKAPFCRNLAAMQASGEILAFIDSDCTADPAWLNELLPAFDDPAIAAVGGFVDSTLNQKMLDRYERVKSSLNMGNRFVCSSKSNRSFYVPSCNLLVKRDVYRQLGGFKEHLFVGEDVDFCWRLQDADFKLAYYPLGKISHRHRSSVIPFCTRRYDYGTSEPILQKEHPERIKTMQWAAGDILFWLCLALSAWLMSPVFFILSLIVLLNDVWSKIRKCRENRFQIGELKLLIVVTRGYLTFLYHMTTLCSRYYLVLLPLILLLSPAGAAILIAAHLGVGFVEYRMKRPDLNLFVFLCFFTLEQLSYQIGVWLGCFKNRHFSSVIPKIKIKYSAI